MKKHLPIVRPDAAHAPALAGSQASQEHTHPLALKVTSLPHISLLRALPVQRRRGHQSIRGRNPSSDFAPSYPFSLGQAVASCWPVSPTDFCI